MMSQGLTAKINKAAVPMLPVFQVMQKEGNISEHDMFNTFNMGVGMCAVVPAEQADEAIEAVRVSGEEAVLLGEVTTGDEGVVLC